MPCWDGSCIAWDGSVRLVGMAVVLLVGWQLYCHPSFASAGRQCNCRPNSVQDNLVYRGHGSVSAGNGDQGSDGHRSAGRAGLRPDFFGRLVSRGFAAAMGLYLALSATWSVVAALLISTGFHGGTTGFAVEKFTWRSYPLTQPGVIVHYLRLAFWPSGTMLRLRLAGAADGKRSRSSGAPPGGPARFDDLGVGQAVGIGFLGVWLFVILAPTSSFVPIKDAAFEHRMYLPWQRWSPAWSLPATLSAAGSSVGGGYRGRRRDHGCFSVDTWGAALGTLTFQRDRITRASCRSGKTR